MLGDLFSGHFSLLVCHLIPPESVLVIGGEAVDDDGDGEGENEAARAGTEAAHNLPEQRLGVERIPYTNNGCRLDSCH